MTIFDSQFEFFNIVDRKVERKFQNATGFHSPSQLTICEQVFLLIIKKMLCMRATRIW